ncbi:alpha/beta hydrolase [Butyrivibrio sp. LC3010]|uniref:alpha/beta hydrolase n=1 Tax=Butyrivibrio sp. LC3010 TaxID=1280680 RepID=UPI0004149FE3|nr:alpha/beta hydrolase [Butyrivibrio sp. LC3010]
MNIIKKITLLGVTLTSASALLACSSISSEGASESDWQTENENYENENSSQEDSEGESGFAVSKDYGDKTQEALWDLSNVFNDYRESAMADPVRQMEVTPVSKTLSTTSGESDPYDICTIEMNGRRMQYTMEIIGEPDDEGMYPLYITMHGGGESTAEENNEQWIAMMNYYRDSVQNGIYVAVRGMEDVWNMHFLEDSYPMYDRLIEDMILLENADPNRVYLLGFSAGGDGVYAVAPRMADRFAAVNMSSGHPNDVSLLNLSNLPIEIQVGIRDYYSASAKRSLRGAEFEDILNGYSEAFGFGYSHRVLVHVPQGHGINDNYVVNDEFIEEYGLQDEDPAKLYPHVLKHPEEFARRAEDEDWLSAFMNILEEVSGKTSCSELSYESPDGLDDKLFEYVTNDLNMEVVEERDTDAVHYVNDYQREPLPQSFIWDLGTRADSRNDNAFYWLKADKSVNQGVIEAVFDKENNTVYLDEIDDVNGEITILANPLMMDFDRPLTVQTPNEEITVDLKPDKKIMEESVKETGDFNLAWADEVTVSLNK